MSIFMDLIENETGIPGPWYHGTSRSDRGEAILACREIRPGNVSGTQRSSLQPISGRTYFSRTLEMPAIYALGGVMMGRPFEEWSSIEKDGRYGYIFCIENIPASALVDEDLLGKWATYANDDLSAKDPLAARGIREIAKMACTPRQIKMGDMGLVTYCARIGKALIRKGSVAHLMKRILAHADEVSAEGPVRWTSAWKLDKQRQGDIARDASNLFEVAERVA